MIGLRRLDLSRCNNCIGELGLNRILVSCKRNLVYLALPYQSHSFTYSIGATISTLTNLETLYLGSSGAVGFSRTNLVPQFELVDHHKFSLEMNTKIPTAEKIFKYFASDKLRNLSVYECNLQVLKLIQKVAGDTL